MGDKYSLQTELQREWYIFLSILVVFLISLAVYPALPEQIATHWNIEGEPDGYGSRFVGAFALTLVTLGLYLFFLVLPLIDPRRENYARFTTTYRYLKLGFVLFLLALHLLTLVFNLGYAIRIGRIVVVGVGLLFTLLGRGLPEIKPNYFVGIRTPWTLASSKVWTKTHRFGGKLFFWSGLLVISSALLPDRPGFWVMMILIVACTLATTIYSYFCFQQEKNERE